MMLCPTGKRQAISVSSSKIMRETGLFTQRMLSERLKCKTRRFVFRIGETIMPSSSLGLWLVLMPDKDRKILTTF